MMNEFDYAQEQLRMWTSRQLQIMIILFLIVTHMGRVFLKQDTKKFQIFQFSNTRVFKLNKLIYSAESFSENYIRKQSYKVIPGIHDDYLPRANTSSLQRSIVFFQCCIILFCLKYFSCWNFV